MDLAARTLFCFCQCMYASAGIPGTGIYAVHHIRRSPGEHPTVAGNELFRKWIRTDLEFHNL
jgi:hypothetical protein